MKKNPLFSLAVSVFLALELPAQAPAPRAGQTSMGTIQGVVTRKGSGQSPVYAFLGSSGKLPAWNFSKYIVDKKGKVVAFFESQVTPEDPALRAAIAKALAASE